MPLTASKPAGTTDGDLLVAFAIHDTDPACPCAPPAAQGWTAYSLPGSETDFASRAWYKQVDASDAPRTDYTFTFAGGDNSAILYLAAFYEDTGTGNWTLEDGTGWAFADPANSISNGGVIAVDNSLFVVAYGNDDNEVVTSNPGSPTKIDEGMAAGAAMAAYYEMVDAIDGNVSYPITWGGGTEQLSAMAGIFSWAASGSGSIDGTVFEDVNYGGGAGRDSATASGVARSGARVELYDSTGTYVTFTTTDGSGHYSFSGLPPVNHTVRVVNSTVTSSRIGYIPGLLGVQTYRTDAGSGSAVPDSARVGGQDPSVTDAGNASAGAVMNATTGVFTAVVTGTAQSITNVAVGASNIPGVDFGFNFDTVVNTNDTGQGSLRQFITNANQLDNTGLAQIGQAAGQEVGIFMISDGAAHPGLRAGLPNLLVGGVATFSLGAALPNLTATSTSIDGTTQTTNVGDTNAGVVGTGGTVGVDAIALPQYNRPEVAIDANGADGFTIDGNASNILIKGLALYDASEGVIALAGAGTDRTVEEVLIGTLPDGSDPGAQRNAARGAVVDSGGSLTVTRCYVGWNGLEGLESNSGTSVFEVTYSEVFGSGWDCTFCDGIDLNGASNIARYNLVRDNTDSGGLPRKGSGNGIECGSQAAGTGNHTVENNTSHGNLSAGITIRNGTSGVTVRRNIVHDNEVGISIDIERSAQTNHNTITENSVYQNNGIGIDIHAGGGGVFDGVTINDPGDTDTGSNDRFNFPVLTTAVINSDNLTLNGFARPNTVIEFFLADADPTSFGEGKTFLLTRTEGTAGDTDTGTGTYTDPVNGLNQGTDTTNRFTFTMPVPAGVADASELTATGTDSVGNTSEFSGLVTVADTTVASVDLAVTKAVDDGTPDEGDTVTYTVTVTNGGPDEATGVVLTDLLPAGVTYVSDTTTQGSYVIGTGVWTVGSIANAASDTLTITATVDAATAGTTIGNTASVTASDQADPMPANDSDSVDITVLAELFLVKRCFLPDGTPVPHGGTLRTGLHIQYVIYINNRGPARSDVSVHDVLDSTFAFQSGTIRLDNSVAACVSDSCTIAEETTIFGSVAVAPVSTDAVDADEASYTPITSTVHIGDQGVGNAQLDIAANAVWATLFEVIVQ